jgi:PAS domain S-box-containing protein
MSSTGHQLSTPHSDPAAGPFAALLDAVPDAIFLVNSEGRIVLANESAERLFGYARGELLGQPADTLLPQRLRSVHGGLAANHFTQSHNGSASITAELVGLSKNSTEFPIQIITRPVPTEEGTCALITIRDLTERARLQQELHNKTAALEAARQEFNSFSHSISHDLRAPLRAIDGFAGMLKRYLGENLSRDSQHALNRIHDNASKMSKLIDGLLDFSTLAWVALTSKELNPGNIAQNSFDSLALSTNGRRVDFTIGELPACPADAALLRRLFDNLISNALKFTRKRDPAVIRVGSRRENGEQVFFIQDNGVGFDMEYAGKLFHVFQHLHSPSEYEGTGMGLAIAQRIVQRHGGRIWAEGRVDHGATFYFTLEKPVHGHSA